MAAHFRNKEYAKELFAYLKQRLTQKVGSVKVESLPCCIHLVSSYTFSGVWALRDGIRIDFRTHTPLTPKRPHKHAQISAHRHLYYFDLKSKREINAELLGWLKQAYYLHE